MPSPHAITTARLSLLPLTVDEARNLVAGLPSPHWSPGYPTGPDVEIAQLWLAQAPHSPDIVAYGPRQILELSTGAVIGGIGFFGPPDVRGRVRFGYGLVPERRNDGVATEATLALLAAAWTDCRVLTALADTTVDNVASQRVLTKAGLRCVSRAGETLFYDLVRPRPPLSAQPGAQPAPSPVTSTSPRPPTELPGMIGAGSADRAGPPSYELAWGVS